MAIRYDSFVKRPFEEHEFEDWQVLELQKCMKDINAFIPYVKIIHPDRGEVVFEPYSYQKALLKKFQKNRFNIGLLARQSGKALALDTPIPQKDGKWTTMGDVKIGDEILGKDGKPTKVIFATDVMHNHDCYEIKFDNNDKVIADIDHLWEVSSGHFRKMTNGKVENHQKKLLTTKELIDNFETIKDNDQSLYIDYHKSIKNKKIKLLIDPYTLGCWLGDGHIGNSRISTNKQDYAEISQIIENNNYNISELKRDKRTKNSGYFTIYKLITKLKKVDISNNKYIPRIYFRASIHQRLQLLRGLMDSDGNCSKKGSCEFYNKNYNLILDVCELLSSLGIKNRIREKIIDNEIYYTISFTTRKFYVFNLTRKRELQKNCLNHPKNSRIYIKNIRKVKSVPVRCIQVDSKDSLFLCGKSMIPTHNTTAVSVYALWYAIFNSDKVIGIVSNKESSAKMILNRLKKMYERLPPWLKPGVKEYQKKGITFDNETQIMISATTEDAFRGQSMNLLICDEFAFVKKNMAKDFWAANYPTISASKLAKVVVISTPNGMHNLFHKLWVKAERGDNEFKTTKVSWREVPGRDQAWADAELKNLGSKQRFNQEHEVEFLGSASTVVDPDVLEIIVEKFQDPIVEDLNGHLYVYEKPKDGSSYILGVDTGKGTGEHYSAIQILELVALKPVKMRQVAVYWNNMIDVYKFSELVNRLSYYYNNAYIMVENNSEGAVVVGRLWWDYENGNLVNTGNKTKDLGIRATKVTKPKAVLLMKRLIEDGSLDLVDEETLDQLTSFVEEKGKFFGKEMPDDLISALYWAVYILEMKIFEEDYQFNEDGTLQDQKAKEDDDDVWGILTDIDTNVEDWSWLDDSKVMFGG